MTARPCPHTPTPWWINRDGCIAAASGKSSITIAGVQYPACADALRKMTANTRFIVRACNAYDRLSEALHQLTDAAWALDAAIDGVTDQFDDEVADLQRALRKAEAARRFIEGGAS